LREGKTNAEIGVILSSSPGTIEKHIASILAKLGFENRKVLISNLDR
jgi:DNA-binding CsgD family transcriptional regulator